MALGTVRTFDGKTYRLMDEGLTKGQAMQKAKWHGKHSYTRIEKLARGNYRLWVGPNKPR